MNALLGMITRSERASSASVFIVRVRASNRSPRATLSACVLPESLSRSSLSTSAPLLLRLHIFPNPVSGFRTCTYHRRYPRPTPNMSATNSAISSPSRPSQSPSQQQATFQDVYDLIRGILYRVGSMRFTFIHRNVYRLSGTAEPGQRRRVRRPFLPRHADRSAGWTRGVPFCITPYYCVLRSFGGRYDGGQRRRETTGGMWLATWLMFPRLIGSLSFPLATWINSAVLVWGNPLPPGTLGTSPAGAA